MLLRRSRYISVPLHSQAATQSLAKIQGPRSQGPRPRFTKSPSFSLFCDSCLHRLLNRNVFIAHATPHFSLDPVPLSDSSLSSLVSLRSSSLSSSLSSSRFLPLSTTDLCRSSGETPTGAPAMAVIVIIVNHERRHQNHDRHQKHDIHQKYDHHHQNYDHHHQKHYFHQNCDYHHLCHFVNASQKQVN